MCSNRRGMTLVELTAAIAVAGLVLLGALLLLDSVNDGVNRIEHDAASATTAGTTFALLQQLLHDATPGFDTTERFQGDEGAFTCWTKCEHAEGWMARCRVRLSVTDTAQTSVLRASFANGDERALQRYGRGARLRYFDADHEAWRTAWDASATIPIAVALVAGYDTAVYSVGPARE